MDFWKDNKFNFLKEEVEEFTRRWSQNLVSLSPSYFYYPYNFFCFYQKKAFSKSYLQKKKPLNMVYEA